MRRYDDPVEVRRGRVPAAGAGATVQLVEGPEQFLWRGRLWKVSTVLAHWVETGAWWTSRETHAVLGADEPDGSDGSDGQSGPVDLVADRHVWRVEADRGMASAGVRGVFDLLLDGADGTWRLSRCLD